MSRIGGKKERVEALDSCCCWLMPLLLHCLLTSQLATSSGQHSSAVRLFWRFLEDKKKLVT